MKICLGALPGVKFASRVFYLSPLSFLHSYLPYSSFNPPNSFSLVIISLLQTYLPHYLPPTNCSPSLSSSTNSFSFINSLHETRSRLYLPLPHLPPASVWRYPESICISYSFSSSLSPPHYSPSSFPSLPPHSFSLTHISLYLEIFSLRVPLPLPQISTWTVYE